MVLQKINVLCIFIFIFLFLANSASADDAVVYTGEPVFKIASKNENIKISEVNLTIRDNRISLGYLIENNSDRDAKITVTIDIPPVSWRGAGNWYPDRSYSELQLYINGSNVDYTRESRAILKNEDVTALLSKYRLKPNDLGDDERWTDRMTPKIAGQYLDLQKVGIFSHGDYPLPQWEACNTYIYKFISKAKEKINIKYEYTRLPGEFYFNKEDQDGLNLLSQLGLNWEGMRQKYDGAKSSDDYYRIKYMNLPLWPGNWKALPDGIPMVNLDIQPGLDHDGKNYLVGLALQDGNIFGTASLHMKLKNFKQDSPLLIQIKPLFNSKTE